MKAKYELRNFIDHYGLRDTLDALADILIETYKDLSPGCSVVVAVKSFLTDMSSEFDIEEQ